MFLRPSDRDLVLDRRAHIFAKFARFGRFSKTENRGTDIYEKFNKKPYLCAVLVLISGGKKLPTKKRERGK